MVEHLPCVDKAMGSTPRTGRKEKMGKEKWEWEKEGRKGEGKGLECSSVVECSSSCSRP